MDQGIPFIDHLLDVALLVGDSIQRMTMFLQRLLKERRENVGSYSLIATSNVVSIKRIRDLSYDQSKHAALEYIPLSRDLILKESDLVRKVRT